MAPRLLAPVRDRGPQKTEVTVDNRSLAHSGSPSSTDQEPRKCFDCYRGVVYIGHVAEDSEAGEEVEVIEAVPCRRCLKCLSL
jgi:hypothetical protein